MCDVLFKECKGWYKSFTRTETVLSLLQASLLVVLIACLVFLTLHLLSCSPEVKHQEIYPSTTANTLNTIFVEKITHSVTFRPDVECSWTPSTKTKATTRYYWTQHDITSNTVTTSSPNSDQKLNEDEEAMNSDGAIAYPQYKNYVAALVMLKLPAEITFGCILTKVSRHWTLTAASCIESIEEVDSLDSFFILDGYGDSKQGLSHAVADVQIHPLYQGANRSYDLAALRSDDALAQDTSRLLRLPTMLDYFQVAIGERFSVLGYGGYRSVDKSVSGRQLRQVWSYTLSGSQCSGADAWSPRHLTSGGATALGACGGACGAGPLCACALGPRQTPCSYCSGTPLVREGLLFGVMSDDAQCGVACEPALYVNVAVLRDWIESVIN